MSLSRNSTIILAVCIIFTAIFLLSVAIFILLAFFAIARHQRSIQQHATQHTSSDQDKRKQPKPISKIPTLDNIKKEHDTYPPHTHTILPTTTPAQNSAPEETTLEEKTLTQDFLTIKELQNSANKNILHLELKITDGKIESIDIINALKESHGQDILQQNIFAASFSVTIIEATQDHGVVFYGGNIKCLSESENGTSYEVSTYPYYFAKEKHVINGISEKSKQHVQRCARELRTIKRSYQDNANSLRDSIKSHIECNEITTDDVLVPLIFKQNHNAPSAPHTTDPPTLLEWELELDEGRLVHRYAALLDIIKKSNDEFTKYQYDTLLHKAMTIKIVSIDSESKTAIAHVTCTPFAKKICVRIFEIKLTIEDITNSISDDAILYLKYFTEKHGCTQHAAVPNTHNHRDQYTPTPESPDFTTTSTISQKDDSLTSQVPDSSTKTSQH